MIAFWSSLLLIGLAELADKTQLFAVALSAKYGARITFIAVAVATFALNGVAVFAGTLTGNILPTKYLAIGSAIGFILVGLWFLRREEEDEEGEEVKSAGIPFLIIFLTFVVAETGDKTQLSAFLLSAKYQSPVGVWMGASLGMLAVNTVGVFVGSQLQKRVPFSTMQKMSAAIFLIIGIILLIGQLARVKL